VVFEEQTACVQEVAQGRADAFIYDQLSIFQYSQANPDTTRGLLRPFVEESWGIGVAKGNDALRQQVNQFLAAFRSSQGFEKLADRYLNKEKRMLDEMGIPFILR
jgi:polar amino acid transport system substrate-binding protein